MFCPTVALADDKVKVVAVPEGVPDRIHQELACIYLDTAHTASALVEKTVKQTSHHQVLPNQW